MYVHHWFPVSPDLVNVCQLAHNTTQVHCMQTFLMIMANATDHVMLETFAVGICPWLLILCIHSFIQHLQQTTTHQGISNPCTCIYSHKQCGLYKSCSYVELTGMFSLPSYYNLPLPFGVTEYNQGGCFILPEGCIYDDSEAMISSVCIQLCTSKLILHQHAHTAEVHSFTSSSLSYPLACSFLYSVGCR